MKKLVVFPLIVVFALAVGFVPNVLADSNGMNCKHSNVLKQGFDGFEAVDYKYKAKKAVTNSGK
jgi:hypothetical protein